MTALPVVQKPAKPPHRPRLKRGDHEFLPAALEILETPMSPIRASLILTICLFAVAALAWSYFGRVDIIAIAQGKIQPIGRTKTVQPIETGKVSSVLVANGQRVKAGDLLMTLDPSEGEADEATLSASLNSFKAERARRVAALAYAEKRVAAPVPRIAWEAGTPAPIAEREQRVLSGDIGQLGGTVASLEGQQREKFAERERLRATVTAQETLVATLKERVDMRSTLFDKNAESKAAVIDAKEVLQKEQTSLAAAKGQLGETEAALSRLGRDIDKTYSAFIADNAQKLADAERQLDDTAQKLAKARIKTAHMLMRSPIDGIVQGLNVTSLGQVVTTGEQLLQIVPEGAELEIECYLPNADVGFVKQDDPAVVKVESFPFTDYGTIDAKVTRVAQDAIPQVEAAQREENPNQPQKDTMFGGGQRTQNLVFPVTLHLTRTSMQTEGRSVPLVPGMAVTVEIKTGTRRILSYLFSPLVEVGSKAFKER